MGIQPFNFVTEKSTIVPAGIQTAQNYVTSLLQLTIVSFQGFWYNISVYYILPICKAFVATIGGRVYNKKAFLIRVFATARIKKERAMVF
ncbi:MAG: hypothetical protein IKW02_00055 [Clostridia bacterium]|nr:hypothetical protein [Clostridia bacterium]